MKKLLLLFLMFTFSGFSQSVNDYQYVLVPQKFEIFKENDKYHLNTTTKLLLQKYGFKSYFITDSVPTAIANSNCNKLYADVIKDNNIFITKLKVVLKDCKDKIICQTDLGTSREKEYPVAYNEAIRAAFKSFDKLNYKYNGKNEITQNGNELDKIPTNTPIENPNSLTSDSPEVFFFAQPIANGFQIVNSEPRVIMRLLNTSQKNTYIGIRGDTTGIVITKNSKWVFEYYEGGKLLSEPINLKF